MESDDEKKYDEVYSLGNSDIVYHARENKEEGTMSSDL